MRAIISTILLGFVLFYGCSQPPSDDAKFESIANNYLQDYMRMYPETSTYLGEHQYDHLMNDYSLKGVQKTLQMHRAYLDSLKNINMANLGATNRIDFQILRDNIKSTIFQVDTLRGFEWNPRNYNVGNGIYFLIARDFAPLKDRLMNVKSRLKAIPEILEHAKKNLKNPPQVYTETAIAQNGGNINMVQNDLNLFLDEIPELKAEFAPVQEAVAVALTEYSNWLKTDLLPRSNGEFRLGDELFRKKLRYTLESNLSKEDILAEAEADLQRTQEAMYQTALPLFKTFFPEKANSSEIQDKKMVCKAVLDKLAEDRPNNETIVDFATNSVAECTEFVKGHDLVTVPDEPLQVIVMPEFRRGFSVAYCDPPGPLEKNAKTFYAISPTPESWTEARAISFFREYNNYMVHNLSIHEGTPGHYLQLAHANAFRAPTMVRAIFSSGTFTEGWGTYAEQLMAEYGFGGPEVKMQQLKMRLRTIINAIIDQSIPPV